MVDDPGRAADVFISYKSDDRPLVVQIRTELEKYGVSTWMDLRDIRGGEYYFDVIVPAIENCKVVLLMCTQRAMESENIAEEIEIAHGSKKPIIPLRLEEYEIPQRTRLHMRARQYIDLVGQATETWLPRVLADLEARGVRLATPVGTRVTGDFPRMLADCFKGRGSELKQLRQRLANPDTRLVLLCGPQGVGKTALIANLAKTERDPVTLVYFASKKSSSLDALAALLGDALPPEASAQWRQAWRDQSPTANKFDFLFGRLLKERLWIVLDDLENVLDDGGALPPAWTSFVEACLTCEHPARIIAVTNVRPKFSPEFEARFMTRRKWLPIDKGLDRASGIDLLRTLEGDEELGIADSSDEFLGTVVERCSGHPQLLKMLIGYLISERTETLRQVVGGEAFPRFLEHPVRAVYEYLTPAERQVVRALAVFDAPVSRDAIAHVVGHSPVCELDTLDRRYVAYGRSPSIQLYPLYQRFAYEQIAPRDRQLLHATAAGWFETQCKPPHAIEALADVEPYASRCQHLMRAGRAAEAEDLLYETEVVMTQRGFAARVAATRGQLTEFLDEPTRRGRNYRCEGLAWSEQGEHQKALACYMRSLAVGVEIDDTVMQWKALVNLGWACNELNDYDQAHQHLTRARDLGGDGSATGELIGNMGDAALNLGRIDEAMELTRQALRLHDGYAPGKAVWLGNLGLAHQCRGEYREAIRYFQEALVIEEQHKLRQRMSAELCRLGRAYLAANEVRRALDLFEQANQHALTIGDKLEQSRALVGLGAVWHYKGEHAKAQTYYEGALALGIARTNVQCHSRLGVLSLHEHRRDEAFRHFDAALQGCRGTSYECLYSRAFARLGRDGEALADYQRAVEQCSAKGVVSTALGDVRLMHAAVDERGVRQAIDFLECSLRNGRTIPSP